MLKIKMMIKTFFQTQVGIILAALLGGISFGFLANTLGSQSLVIQYLKPIGSAWIQALQAICIPLIVFSLTKGILELRDLSQLSSLGTKALGWLLGSTAVATVLGLVVVNVFNPGTYLSAETTTELLQLYPFETSRQNHASTQPWLLSLIPTNLLDTFTNNKATLSVIIITIVFAIAILQSDTAIRKRLGQLFSDFNEVLMKVIDYIMWLAPFAVFVLLAALVVETPRSDLLLSMLFYVGTVVIGLAILAFGLYPLMVWWLTDLSPKQFLRGISKAQLVAISTSSSAATLPITLECVKHHLQVRKETANFILPLGATCNMDATAMYQSIAAVFVAQLFGLDLSVTVQFGIIATAALGSIGAAAVPGGGIVMLTIVLEQAGLPLAGLGLLLALDRPLDMLRTAVNITSDAALAKIIDR